ncbi:hypothetical protein TNCV_2522631 [Trichonephila clavipes]|nr:hypothetical protein TNCV_2522631 [Trichonephila clavipes]
MGKWTLFCTFQLISGIKDRVGDSDAVNKKYLKNKLGLVSDSFMRLNDIKNSYTARNLYIENVKDPKDPQDVVTKNYLEKNSLILKNDLYDVNNKRIANVGKPLLNGDVASKGYVDQKNVYAYSTIAIEDSGKVRFNIYSSSLLNDKMELSVDMFMKISVTFCPGFMSKIAVGDQIIYNYRIVPEYFKYKTIVLYEEGKRGNKMEVSLKPDVGSESVFTYLEVINI